MATSPQKRKQQNQLSHLQGEEEDDDNYFDDDLDATTGSEEMEDEEQTDGLRSHRQKKRRRKQTQQPSLSRQGPNNNKSMTTATNPFGKPSGDDMYMEGGPVTRARASRGEIPTTTGGGNNLVQPAPQNQKPIEEEDGIKLKVELNLDVEVELKAAIGGDLTLTLL